MLRLISHSLLLYILISVGMTPLLAEESEKPREEMTLKDLRDRSFTFKKELLPEEALKRSVEGYQYYIDSPLGGAMRREALRRLADRMLQQLEMQEEQQVSGEELLLKDASYDKAIEYYNEALTNYSKFPGNEHILYQMARAYEANGEPKQAIWALKQLVEHHEESDYVDEANFRVGELSFLTQQFDQANSYYQQLIELGEEHPLYRIAMYKAGWALFKKKDYPGSLDQFIVLLDFMIADAPLEEIVAELPELSAGEREMLRDTLRVMSIAFSHQEEPLKYLSNYLAKLDTPRSYQFLIYQSLGDLFYGQTLYLDAGNSYNAFTQKHLHHPHAPFLQIMAIESFRLGNFSEAVEKAKLSFVGNFSYTSSFWGENKPQILKSQVEPYLRQYLSSLAMHHHAALQKEATASNKQQALYWYRSYLDSFSKDSEAAHINFLLAELLFETADYESAALEYNNTAYNYGHHKEAQEAGYAAILAHEKQMELLTGDARDSWRRQSVENALHFAKVYGNDPRVPSIVTKTAQDLFDVGAYDTAIKAASIVLTLRGLNEEMQRSAHLVLGHSYFEKYDYHHAENSYKSALRLTQEQHEDYQGTYERIAASIYKQAEHQQQRNNLQAAIHEYQRLVKDTPLSKIRDTALYDTATAMLQIKSWHGAIDILVKMRETPFGKKKVTDISQKLTVAYLETNQDQKAAAQLELLSLLESDYEVQREAIWRAAELYEKAGNVTATIKAFEDYVKRYPAPIDANIEARYKLAQLYLQQHNKPRYLARLKDVIESDKKALEQRTPRTRYLAGISSMTLADMGLEAYREIKLVEPIKKNLKLKKDKMQQTIKDYGKVTDYEIAELITNSTFKISEIYRDFAKALMESQRPKGLDDEELEMYEIMLEEQAFPFEEKAIDLHEKNYRRISDGIYDPWVRNSLKVLGEITPGRYDKIENEVGYIEIFN